MCVMISHVLRGLNKAIAGSEHAHCVGEDQTELIQRDSGTRSMAIQTTSGPAVPQGPCFSKSACGLTRDGAREWVDVAMGAMPDIKQEELIEGISPNNALLQFRIDQHGSNALLRSWIAHALLCVFTPA